jgi:hypothetical protein
MVLQPRPASGQLNVSSPPKGRGFHVRFSEKRKEGGGQKNIFQPTVGKKLRKDKKGKMRGQSI